MKKVRFGIVGVSTMGLVHADGIIKEGGRDCCLTAVADNVAAVARRAGREYGVPHFTDSQKMFDSGLCDAVIIATPHYWHAPLTIRAARAGLHVLCEKPIAAAVGPARAMLAECKKQKVALGVVFQMRTRNIMKKAKQLVDSGRIGEVFRIQLICSSWFRTQKYYDSGSWRGTWADEGGGVLINQAPHHLDLFQWVGGVPKRVRAVLGNRAHKIEVEDTANAIFEYDNGKIGYLYATTAEEPGCEQFTFSGEKGTLIIENGKIRLGSLKVPVSEHIKKSRHAFVKPGEQKITWRNVPYPTDKGQLHMNATRAFARHIRLGSPMTASGAEAVNELEMSNAAYISGYRDKTVKLPVNAEEMDRLLDGLERKYGTGRGGTMRTDARRELRKLLRVKQTRRRRT